MSTADRAETRQFHEEEEEEEEEDHHSPDLAVAQEVTAERNKQHGEGGVGTEGRSLVSEATPRVLGDEKIQRAPSYGSTSQQPARPSPNPSLTPSLATWDTRAAPSPQPMHNPALAPSDFRPFFTLIESPAATFHHPTVHYIFSDDEDHESVLTSAALNAITQQDGSEDTARGGEVEERVVLLDLQADGRTVAGIKSLSGEWQGLQAEVGQAPSWGGGGDGGMMVRIRGKEGDEVEDGHGEVGGLEELVERFGRGLGGLDEVLGTEAEEEMEAEE